MTPPPTDRGNLRAPPRAPRLPILVLAAAASVASLNAQSAFAVGTLAGSAPGSTDGVGAAARFRGGGGIAVDGSGTFYVADAANDTIRRVTASGAVTTLAGSAGLAGTSDGVGAAARFNTPAAVAVDGAGNVYVADYGNNTIRKVTAAGVVSTLAGAPGNPGPSGDSSDGMGAAAGFFHPGGLAVDGSGTLFVADSGNGTIRKVTPAGLVTTIAGAVGVAGSADGMGTASRFDYPSGITIDSSGNLFVTDLGADTVRKITPAGLVSTVAGTAGQSGSADGAGAAARFFEPQGSAIDASGNLFVVDGGNNEIRKVTPEGVVTTLAGSAAAAGSADGIGSAARFTDPYGAAVDASGNVFVTDDTTLREVAPDGTVSTFAGVETSGFADGEGPAARFSMPKGVAVDAGGTVYVADSANDTVRRLTPAGVVTTLAGSPGAAGSADGNGAAGRFNGPVGIAVDSSGDVYVADAGNDTIRRVTPAGTVTTLAGVAGVPGSADGPGAAATFRLPYGLALDTGGNLYVADSGNDTVRRITPAGAVTTLAGSPGVAGSVDGTGAAARFSGPGGLAIGASGTLFVTDNSTVRSITPQGVVSTLAGTPNLLGSADGVGSAASFRAPSGVAADAEGDIFVADTGNNTLREITPAGAVSTVAGVPGVAGSTDGMGAAALFAGPSGIAWGAGGEIYVGDTANNTVRIAVPAAAASVDTGNAWLVNLSARAFLPPGGAELIAGFVTTGPAPKSLLIRGDGPALGASGIADFLADPQLAIVSGQTTLAQTASWSPALSAVFSRVGAFALTPGSHDDALVLGVTQGPYTAQLSSQAGGSGLVLAEIYDADGGAPANRLVNLSARAQVGPGESNLIGGFAVAGTTDEELLVRAVGPGLAAFGVAGALARPVLTLYGPSGAVIATNVGWGNPVSMGAGAILSGPGAMAVGAATPGIFSRVGAFALPAGSADSAMVVALPPGDYTAQVSGDGGMSGAGLVEIYEIAP